jgi:hypothetical protein
VRLEARGDVVVVKGEENGDLSPRRGVRVPERSRSEESMGEGSLENYDVINVSWLQSMEAILWSDASLENALSTLEVQKTRRRQSRTRSGDK